MRTHRRKDFCAKPVCLDQMEELAYSGFVRCGFAANVDSHKPAHRRKIIDRILSLQIRKFEPLLQKLNAQHALHTNRRTTALALGIVWLKESTQSRPWHYQLHLHLCQKAAPRGSVYGEPQNPNSKASVAPSHHPSDKHKSSFNNRSNKFIQRFLRILPNCLPWEGRPLP